MEFDSYNYFNNTTRKIENIEAVNVEIKIMKDIIDKFEKSFQQKQAQLSDTNVELNNLDQEIWMRRNASCCQVWNFSCDHNFLNIFEHYPYIMNPIKFHNCEYNAIIGGSIKDECAQNNEHVQKLEEEIIILKKELNSIMTNKNTEITTQNFSIKLGRLKLFSEEIVKLLKLIHNNESLNDQKLNKNSEVLECKNNNLLINANRNNMLKFTKAKILIGQHNSNSHVLREHNDKISRMIMENNNTTEYYILDTNKQFKNKFVVKTQSNILLKFEQERCLKKNKK